MENFFYNEAGIAGKFRMIHVAHKELVLRAVSLAKHVHVFIVDVPTYKRHASITKVIETFERIFDSIAFTEFSIHIITEELSGEAWDLKVLELAPNIDVMFDSKEIYDNILVKNAFVPLKHATDISVSKIEQHPFNAYYASLIAREFWKHMLQHMFLVGVDGIGKTILAKKLASFYQTQYTDDKEGNGLIEEWATRYVFHDNVDLRTMQLHNRKVIIQLEVDEKIQEDIDLMVNKGAIVIKSNKSTQDEMFIDVIEKIEALFNA